VVHADHKFLSLSAGAFIRDVVMERFRPTAMVEGDSFCYGQHRRGTVDTLRAEGRTYGFDVDIIEPIRINLGGSPSTVISSSLIRHLLKSGTVDQVAQCLGRPYVLLGKVKPGAGRGRTLGFPTANLSIASQLIPPEGVYAGRAQLVDSQGKLGKSIVAAVSVGRALTFEAGPLLVEAHLLDFEDDLYEQEIRLEFLAWIRDQRKFDTPEALSRQIEQDVTRIREVVQSSHR
jgi:riboflavin kinase/FMN adenylyltransferase